MLWGAKDFRFAPSRVRTLSGHAQVGLVLALGPEALESCRFQQRGIVNALLGLLDDAPGK